MSGDRYFITDQHATYFLTFTVVDWIDIFTRPEYKQVIVDSLNYCCEQKGLECFAWVLMSNHMHIIARAQQPARISDVAALRDQYGSHGHVAIVQKNGWTIGTSTNPATSWRPGIIARTNWGFRSGQATIFRRFVGF